MASPLIAPLMGWIPDDILKNWAGNLEYSTQKITYADNIGQLQELVKSKPKLKVLGTRHCFNRIADSKDYFVSLRKMNKVVSLDESAKTVTIEGGMNYGELCPYLEARGFALHNLASLPHISVAGAATTATHGSGVKNGNLATGVAGLEFIAADGSLVSLTKASDMEKFSAAVVSLGALGVIATVTLDLRPTYTVRQYVYQGLPFAELKQHFDEILSAAYSISLFTDWQKDSVNEVWIKSIADDSTKFDQLPVFYGAKAAPANMHPIAALSAENCTEQLGVPGPWFDRLPHFRMGFTPSSGVELQSEFFVPREHGLDAFMAISKMGKEIGPHLMISEIRTIDQDDFWMSPCYKQPSVALHFTWKQDWPAVSKLLPKIEAALAPYNARPHWGKLFTMDGGTLKKKYANLKRFQDFIDSYDPARKFGNGFLESYIYA